MRVQHFLALGVVACATFITCAEVKAADRQPNVIVIISDDAGYADFSVHGSQEFPTPRIDSIAKRGVRFAEGYVSASVCSPSRAGLMTGRYQQRFGHEMNIPPKYSETNGLSLDEQMLPQAMKDLGYRTIGLGKWHLGYADHFHPCSRGFDDYYGFLQGARSYFPLNPGSRLNRLLRNKEPIPEKFDYMTDELGQQAVAYIEEHRQQPFFLYLAFNAVHTPMHAKPGSTDQVSSNLSERRRKLAAMTIALDDAVGQVLDALAKNDLEKDTLLFFVNDNGGATSNSSSNTPLRGHKGTPFEGGLRVPFLAQWPGTIKSGTVYQHPVSALDLFPTAIRLAGHTGSTKKPLDGVDLIPYLTGKKTGRPHDTLYWRKGPNWAIRDGDWKLLSHRESGPLLFDIKNDPNEKNDLAFDKPELVSELLAKYRAWESQLAEPLWGSARRVAKRKKKG